MSQMQVRARTLQPGGTLVHDVFAPEDSPWRAAAEFFLAPLVGDYYFSDMGNEDDWLGFCADIAKHPEDDFAVVEDALQWFSDTHDGAAGKRAQRALEALENLAQGWAERSANAVQKARDTMQKGWD